MPPTNSRALLLVSVRSEQEAFSAIAGGADILDVKDPARGSLGCADPLALNAVCQKASARNTPVTTALGEVSEWDQGGLPEIPRGVAFAKMGLAGLAGQADWIEQWLSVRRRFDRQRIGFRWVAVAYVDETVAAAPPIHEVLTAAIDTGCAGLLLDTFDKSGGRLFDYISEPELDEIAARMHAEGKFVAAAGRLGLSDVSRLAGCAVDIVAVRSAACSGSDRQSVVTTELVAACKAALQRQEPRLSDAC